VAPNADARPHLLRAQVSGLGRSLTGTLPLEGHFQIIAVRVLQYNL
jgi:hypothetical protein